MHNYRSLLNIVPNTAAEAPASYACLTERHVQALWLEQKYFKGLKTTSGLAVTVISPGIWNAGAGPDFLKAHLEIGGKAVKGDIEIHLSEHSWKGHNHHVDPRYGDVVLHLVLWRPKKEAEESQCSFHTAYLEPYLSIPASRLPGLIDLELYPYKKFLGSGRCAKQLFKAMDADKAARLFSDAAMWRLAQKAQRLKAVSPNPRLWLGAGIAMSLGYRRNAEPFLQLYQWLNKQPAHDAEQLFSLCLQACGFFSVDDRKRWEGIPFYDALLQRLPPTEVPALPLSRQKIRPFNHPVRRLAYLARLVADPSHYMLAERLFSLWDTSWREGTPAAVRERLLEALPSYADPFFNAHYMFGGSAQGGFLPLIGTDLKRTILVNAFLPLLAERIGHGNAGEEGNALKQLYASFPAEHSGKAKYLVHRFFGDTPKGKLLQRGDLEQGAYQLHHDFCIHYEASCDGCPFVGRAAAIYS